MNPGTLVTLPYGKRIFEMYLCDLPEIATCWVERMPATIIAAYDRSDGVRHLVLMSDGTFGWIYLPAGVREVT